MHLFFLLVSQWNARDTAHSETLNKIKFIQTKRNNFLNWDEASFLVCSSFVCGFWGSLAVHEFHRQVSVRVQWRLLLSDVMRRGVNKDRWDNLTTHLRRHRFSKSREKLNEEYILYCSHISCSLWMHHAFIAVQYLIIGCIVVGDLIVKTIFFCSFSCSVLLRPVDAPCVNVYKASVYWCIVWMYFLLLAGRERIIRCPSAALKQS